LLGLRSWVRERLGGGEATSAWVAAPRDVEDGAGAEGAKWGGRQSADIWRTAGRMGHGHVTDGGARGVRGARRAAALKGHLACDADARQTSVSRETLASWIQMQVVDDGHAALRMGAMRLRDTA